MSLHRPFFVLTPESEGVPATVQHNCNGGISFRATDIVDEGVARLIVLALEEGKRRRSRDINSLLQDA